MEGVVETWQALDARLRVVESRLGVVGREGRDDADRARAPAPPPQAEVFWALEALRTRLAGVDGGGVVLAGTVETPAGKAEWQYGMTTDALLATDDTCMETAAGRLSALGNPARLRLLLAVLGGRTSTAALAELDGMGTTGQIYHHIRILTTAGWLRSAGRGRVHVPAERMVPLLVALTTAL